MIPSKLVVQAMVDRVLIDYALSGAFDDIRLLASKELRRRALEWSEDGEED